MERLTAKHFKEGDGYYLRCSESCQASCCEGCDIDGQDVDRLGEIEDILGDDYELDWLRELVEADKAKRVGIDANCGNCAHFHYIHGTKSGKCGMRSNFTTIQSQRACKIFINRTALAKEANYE